MKNTAILKLNGKGSTSLSVEQRPQLEEYYKQIPEDQNFKHLEKQHYLRTSNNIEVGPKSIADGKTSQNNQEKAESNLLTVANKETGKMAVEPNVLNDGADEKMLNGVDDQGKLTDKREEVKFIKGGDHQNGDAKIDIGVINGKDKEPTFTGMTKEELMKYANDPFWIRLRWIFFIGFWAIWVAMLVCAILIIIDAPKCAAPEQLPWYKRGLLAKLDELKLSASDVVSVKSLEASGVIYELPAELTYLVNEPVIEQKIKNIVESFEKMGVNIILDITPNFVSRNATMMKNALKDSTKRSAFIWKEGSNVPSNWRSLKNGPAWDEVTPGNYVLSQYGEGLYDLHMNDTIVRQELENVLKHLISLGVTGFRLKNTKFFLLSENTPDEVPSSEGNFVHDEYGFWTHSYSTFQDGLGDLLYEYKMFVKNISAYVFLSVADDILRPEIYRNKHGEWGVDMPIYGPFVQTLKHTSNAPKLQSEFENTVNTVGNDTWLQWNFADSLKANTDLDPTAIALCISLLPGVPVVPIRNSSLFKDVPQTVYAHIKQLRLSPSYMHGEYNLYGSDGLFAYSRIKSGNPGYFVAFNPSNETVTGDFSHLSLPDKMTVYELSSNYNVSNIAIKSKVETKSLKVSAKATIILTYVPVK